MNLKNWINLFILISTISLNSYAQTFKPHIGLRDRLMNTFLLCDRAVVASIAALYEEVDVAKYNEEYDKFVACSKEAVSIALNPVLTKNLTCEKASKKMFKKNFTCQIAKDNSDNDEIMKCQKKIIKICNDYLIEKDIK